MRNFTVVVFFIGMTLLLDVAGIIVLAVQNDRIPDVLVTIAVAALTALAGLLARPGPDTPPNAP